MSSFASFEGGCHCGRVWFHTFCRVCGVHPFYTPRFHPDGVDVNVKCLDGDAASLFTVTPFDGAEWGVERRQNPLSPPSLLRPLSGVRCGLR